MIDREDMKFMCTSLGKGGKSDSRRKPGFALANLIPRWLPVLSRAGNDTHIPLYCSMRVWVRHRWATGQSPRSAEEQDAHLSACLQVLDDVCATLGYVYGKSAFAAAIMG